MTNRGGPITVITRNYTGTRYRIQRAMNGGAKCRKWGGFRALKEGHGQCHHSIERIRLPIRL